jgi:hypothetical protein
MMKERKFLPTISELIDRLSIVQLKECKIPENKVAYAEEISDIVHDIQLIINETDQPITAEMVRAIIVCAQMNAHIWYNESNVRSGKEGPSMLALKFLEVEKITKLIALRLTLKIGK